MKWNKYTIETTTAAEDYMSAMLADLGIEGVEIEDNIPAVPRKIRRICSSIFCRSFRRMTV